MDITKILTVILIMLASALCIALINFRYQIGKSVRSIISIVKELSTEINPLLISIHKIFKKLNYMSTGIESKLQISRSIISNIRERADIILDTETKIRKGMEDSDMFLIKNFNAVGKGIESFRRTYKNKKLVSSTEETLEKSG
jgi:uncharacterized protein YoxC